MTHERRKLTPDYDEGSLEANGLHSDPKKSPEKTNLPGFAYLILVIFRSVPKIKHIPEFVNKLNMFDVALKSAGAQVVLATSSDDRFPPENIIDGDQETFWTTTGLFPQEFVIKFSSVMNISRVELACCNVRSLILEKSTDSEPLNFEPIKEQELKSGDGHLQSEEINISNVQAQHLRVIIDSAYDHFAAVYRLHVDGTAAR